MDEVNLKDAYNDVDLCLRAIQRGYRVVCNPYALAYHHEGLSRGTGAGNDDPTEELYFKQRWFNVIRKDPYYNPNLSLENEHFEIKQANNPKKILFVTHNLNYEGAPRSLFLLANEFRRRNMDVTILSPTYGPLMNEFLSEDIDVIIDSSLFTETSKGISFAKNFDYIYVNTILTHNFVKIAKLAEIPTVWCIRESEREHYVKEGVDFNQFNNADRVVFVADATRKIYSDLNTKNNFVTIPNGVDLGEINSFKLTHKKSDLRKQYNFSKNDTIITIVGTVTERKGQLTFVKAAIELLKQNSRHDLKFVIVGCRENDYLKQIKQEIEKSNTSSNFILVPETNKVFDYYYISDMFVCASVIESFPRIILESMAFELPIVSTNVFGIPEQITDKIHGILIEPKNSSLLAKKIQYLLDNPKIAKKYGNQAYKRIESYFILSNVTDKHIQLLDEIEPKTENLPILKN